MLLTFIVIIFVACNQKKKNLNSNSVTTTDTTRTNYYEIIGKHHFVLSWESNQKENGFAIISSGETISIEKGTGINVRMISVNLKCKNETLNLNSFEESETLDTTTLSVIEHDFDNDSINEIVLINSDGGGIVNVLVYKHENCLIKLVANLSGQFIIKLDKNSIILPYGSQGLCDEYLYRNNNFYVQVWHNPEETTQY